MDENDKPRVKPAKKSAAGLGAVVSTTAQALKHMGIGRSLKTLLAVNQKKGFDCPGCAWPDPDDRRSLVEFCENGAKAVADEAMRRTIGREFFAHWSITGLREQSDYWLGQQGRLAEPMWKDDDSDHYRPISWPEAFALVGTYLKNLPSPDAAAFYTSGRTSNEAAFLYQLFVRLYGTNNLPDCSNLCHESSGAALNEVLGSGKGSVTLDDFQHAGVIIVIGQNPGTNHPRMLLALQEAKRKGAKIISINPLKEAGLLKFNHPQEVRGILGRGTELSDLYLQVRINGDVAALKGIMKCLLQREREQRGVFDWEFIKEYTAGAGELLQHIEKISWQMIEKSSGLKRAHLEDAATMIATSQPVICCWAMGVTQHKNAVGNIKEIVNLLLLQGNLGKKGAGACPVRGHSNVQGDRTMGIWEKPSALFLDQLQKVFSFEPPRHHGFDVVETIEAMNQDRVQVLTCLGGNFLAASPDTELTEKGLSRCKLTVHISTKLNRSHLFPGKKSLILPCLGRTEIDIQQGGEQFVTVENSMGVVHQSQGNLEPASKELKSEPAIVAGIAAATLPATKVHWHSLVEDYGRIRNLIAETIPGFHDFNHRVQNPGGFYLPHAVRDERRFPTKTGKAHFTVNEIPVMELQDGEFLMMTIRSHDQYNTTIYGLDDRYRGIEGGRKVILMHADDMALQRFKAEEKVDIFSCYDNKTRVARGFFLVPYDIPRQCVATYFPETNVLVPLHHKADISGTPASKSVVVTIRPAEGVSSVS